VKRLKKKRSEKIKRSGSSTSFTGGGVWFLTEERANRKRRGKTKGELRKGKNRVVRQTRVEKENKGVSLIELRRWRLGEGETERRGFYSGETFAT